MRRHALALVAVLLGAPVAASAQPFQGFYIGGGVGYGISPGIQATPPYTFSGNNIQLERNGGIVGLGSIGYGFGNGFRIEVEGSYRPNTVTGLSGTNLSTSGSGTLQSYGAMANVFFDMDIGSPWIYPYVGAGIGYGWEHLNNVSLTQSGMSFATNGTEGNLAWQAIGGVSLPVWRMPGLSITAEYRYHSIIGNQTFEGSSAAGAPTELTLGTEHDHDFLLGIRYAFGVQPPPAPAPAPAAAPAPAPARSYLVFFDWDKATLTPRAEQIIKEAADASTHVQVTRIEVNGYTDTSGSPHYNMGLSMRRAQAVAAELVKDGVPKNEISIHGFGETHLLVPTGPGVREPQNRRVEIIIR
jgi:OmpA-OmpF porin, OOP family